MDGSIRIRERNKFQPGNSHKDDNDEEFVDKYDSSKN